MEKFILHFFMKTKEISECKYLHKKWPSNHLAFAALNWMFGYLSATNKKKIKFQANFSIFSKEKKVCKWMRQFSDLISAQRKLLSSRRYTKWKHGILMMLLHLVIFKQAHCKHMSERERKYSEIYSPKEENIMKCPWPTNILRFNIKFSSLSLTCLLELYLQLELFIDFFFV